MVELTRILLGVLLILAAILKTHQIANVFDAANIAVTENLLRGFLVALESFIGCWLLFGKPSKFLFWLPFCFFLGALFVGVANFFRGAESCGCFGLVKTSPMQSIYVSLLAIALVGITRRKLAAVENPPPRFLGFCCGFSSMVIGTLLVFFEPADLKQSLGLNKSDVITASVSTMRLAVDRRLPQQKRAEVVLRNNGLLSPVTIIGLRAGPRDEIADLPIKISPGSEQEIRCVFRWLGTNKDSDRPCTRQVQFLFSDGTVSNTVFEVEWHSNQAYLDSSLSMERE